ncbi:MAG: hypothetical protein PVH29_00885 [Candidatus Zixiibacteriota bacterium]|jgi:hypothetical protein
MEDVAKWVRRAGLVVVTGWAVVWFVLPGAMLFDEDEPKTPAYVGRIAVTMAVAAATAVLAWRWPGAAAPYLLLLGAAVPAALTASWFEFNRWATLAWAASVITLPCWFGAGAFLLARRLDSRGGKR